MAKALLMVLEAHKVWPNESGECGSGGCDWAAVQELGVSLQISKTAYCTKVIWHVGKGYTMSCPHPLAAAFSLECCEASQIQHPLESHKILPFCVCSLDQGLFTHYISQACT